MSAVPHGRLVVGSERGVTPRGGGALARLQAWVVDGGIGLVTVLAFIFLYVPIVALVIFSFNRSSLASHWTGFTWHWYSTLANDSGILGALKVSAIVAVSSAAISTVIGLVSAVALTKRAFRGRGAFIGLLFLPLLLPEIVLAIAYLTLLSQLHVTLGYLSLIGGHVVLTLPYATLLLLGATSQLDPSLEEAASDLGCSSVRAFLKLTLPLLLPAVLGAFLLSFSVSFEDVVMSNFLSGVGTTTLPVDVYGLLKTGVTPEINALGTILVAGTLAVVVLIGVRQLASGLSQHRVAKTEEAGA